MMLGEQPKHQPATIFLFLALSVMTASAMELGSYEAPEGYQDSPLAAVTSTSAFDEQLNAFDRKTATVRDIRTDFEQRKYTTLLKKPIISRGILIMKGNQARWDTHQPKPSTLMISPTDISLFYPDQALLEIYALDDKLHWIAVSPAPQMATLREQFNLAPVSIEVFPKRVHPPDSLCIRATPRDETMRDYLDHIDILIDKTKARIVASIITDPDGDRTELIFSKMRANTGIGDREFVLSVPAGTKTVHPLGRSKSQSVNPSGGKK